jgi:hypothetical protein
MTGYLLLYGSYILFLWGVLSDERMGLSFVYPAGPCRAVILGSESLETRDHILLSQTRDFPFRRLLRLAGSRWRYSTPPPHGSTDNSSQSHIATDGQSVSKSWCRAPYGTHDQIFAYYYLTVTVLYLWGALSDEDGSVFCMLLGLPNAVLLWSESLGTRDHIYCLRFETSHFVASYDSQGHGGGIRPRLHSELLKSKSHYD